MQQISSVQNKLVKQLAKLNKKKYRQQTGLYLVEGYHLLGEALQAHRHYLYLLGTSAALKKAQADYQVDLTSRKVVLINQAIARHLTATKHSQDVFLVLKMGQPKEFNFNYGKWVLLDDIADPGNAGTIIRTADAAGFAGVVLSPHSVDIYNPKTQRAMQGSQFHLQIIVAALPRVIAQLQNSGIPVYASMLDKEAKKLPEFKKVAQLGLIIGNEAHGVSQELAHRSDQKLYIPIRGKAESLNAAVAAGIMIYYFA